MMEFGKASNLLSQYGISVSGKFIWKKEELENTLCECGEESYAMKAISPAVIHKTEKGAVKLGVKNFNEASAVWEELWKVPETQGILVQKMIKGREVIIGMKRDNTFGPTMLFGLGGILAEAIKDTTLRVAPLSTEEALKMMHEIKGVKILEGMRGEPAVNFDFLADIIVSLSRLAMEHPEIKEIDLNPVICSENSAAIADARVMV
jgi:acyl-CoA synthetase (NDP forming)